MTIIRACHSERFYADELGMVVFGLVKRAG